MKNVMPIILKYQFMNTHKSVISIIISSFFLLFTVNCDAKLAKLEPLEELTLKLGSFSKVQLDGGYEVLLIQGNDESISIQVEKDFIKNVKTAIKDGKLHIYNEKNDQDYTVRLIIRFKNIEEIEFNGGVSLKCKQPLTLSSLNLHVAGGADIKMQLNVKELKCNLDGGVNAEFAGKVSNLTLNLNGAGRIDAEKLKAENVNAKIAGAGFAVVSGSNIVDAEISGIGSIEYTGNPVKVKSVVNGLGSIKEKD